ncbi:translation initiation factor IF-2-like [Chiroxiphia lanceolata]|uniref:translation initiation factor IF-2-like n=1 Tax=Chiroxiphia lanceolata TaxID=296741 RepID=UPI0013CECE1B|nr:translation initiation factor IF-2-like [Chiroxiphia lanceolata]
MEKLVQTEQGTTRVPRSPRHSGLPTAPKQSPCCRQLHKQGRNRSQEQPQKGKHSAGCAGGKPGTSRHTPDTLFPQVGHYFGGRGATETQHCRHSARKALAGPSRTESSEARLPEHGAGEGLCCASPGTLEGNAGYQQGRDAGLGPHVELKAGAQSQGALGGAAGPPLSLSCWPAPRRRRCLCPSARPSLPLHLPMARPAGRRDPGAGSPRGPAPPRGAARGDWCRQRVRPPRSARAGSRDRGGGGRGRGPQRRGSASSARGAAPAGGSAAPSPGSRRGARARRPQPTGRRQTRARRCAAPAAPTWPPAGRRKRLWLPLPAAFRVAGTTPAQQRRALGPAPAVSMATAGPGRQGALRRKHRRHQVTGPDRAWAVSGGAGAGTGAGIGTGTGL